MRPLALLALIGACACTTPPNPVPSPPDGFDPNQTAAQVLAEVQAAGCQVDGGLAGLEQEHARISRPASVDCLFLVGSTVAQCGCP
jgi:hypothetical protein